MNALARFVAATGAVRRNRRGVAALEFALVATVLLLLLLAMYDLGNAIQQQMLLAQALRAGGQYGVSYPTRTGDVVNLTTETWSALSPVATLSCVCKGSGDCSACTGTIQRYLTLTASSPPVIPFLLSGIGGGSATYVVRVQ